jgi:long-chain acyl-CoA synthetase
VKGTSPAPTPPAADVGGLDTLPKLLLRNAVQHADRPAMRHKDYGIWQTWTWAQLHDEVYAFAIGLRKLGLERGDVAAIIGDNRPRLYATFAAVQSLGGIPVPVYQDSVADEMAYVLEHAEVNFAIVQDQEQVDKLLSLSERLPRLRRIIYEEERGLGSYDTARLHAFAQVQQLGRKELAENPGAAGWWLDEIAKGKGSDVSVMLYTSGTTGRPKGVMLTHDNIYSNVEASRKAIPFEGRDIGLSFLPLSHIFERMAGHYLMFATGTSIAYAESIDTVAANMVEVRPTLVLSVPRLYEKMYARILETALTGGFLKKRIFFWARDVAERWANQKLAGKEPAGLLAGQYAIAQKLVFSKLHGSGLVALASVVQLTDIHIVDALIDHAAETILRHPVEQMERDPVILKAKPLARAMSAH